MNTLESEVIQLVFNFSHLYNNIIYTGIKIEDFCGDDLNKTHIRALLYIDFYSSSTMTDISRRLEMEKGSFTPVAKKLISLGYLEGEKSQQDKRKVLLKLTPKGQTFTALLKEELSRSWHFQLDALRPKERRSFIRHISEAYRLLLKIKHLPAEDHPFYPNY